MSCKSHVHIITVMTRSLKECVWCWCVQDLLVEVFAADMPGAVEASEVQEPLGTTQAQQLNLQTDDPHLKVSLHTC